MKKQFMVMIPVLVESESVEEAIDIVIGRVEGIDGVLDFDRHNVIEVEE